MVKKSRTFLISSLIWLLMLAACAGSAGPAVTTPIPTTEIGTDTAVVNAAATPMAMNVAATPNPTETPTPPACLATPGLIEQDTLESEFLRKGLDYSVYLPPCYTEDTSVRYPVLYLIHGQSYTDDQWIRLGMPATADRLIANGQIPALIIVMPRDRVWSQPEDDPFGQAVIEELIPYIDRHYRTLPDREHRAIGGLSRGAGWAVHLGLSEWQLFGAIGGHSLPVFWSDTGKITRWLDAIPVNSLPRIYLDIGKKDRPPILHSATWFEQLLSRKHVPHEWYLFDGYHEEAYWSTHVEQYLRWYAERW